MHRRTRRRIDMQVRGQVHPQGVRKTYQETWGLQARTPRVHLRFSRMMIQGDGNGGGCWSCSCIGEFTTIFPKLIPCHVNQAPIILFPKDSSRVVKSLPCWSQMLARVENKRLRQEFGLENLHRYRDIQCLVGVKLCWDLFPELKVYLQVFAVARWLRLLGPSCINGWILPQNLLGSSFCYSFLIVWPFGVLETSTLCKKVFHRFRQALAAYLIIRHILSTGMSCRWVIRTWYQYDFRMKMGNRHTVTYPGTLGMVRNFHHGLLLVFYTIGWPVNRLRKKWSSI